MRDLFLVTAMCICTVILSFGQTVPEKDSRPNIVIVLADDMGFSDLGATGSEISTPNLGIFAHSPQKVK